MRKSRFSEQQINAILKEQEAGPSTAEVCRRHGFSQPTFYSWKPKNLLAEEVMDNATLKEMLEKNF